MNSFDIKQLLENRHCNDLFIPECKIGASINGCLRFDGWAMKKSWANPECIGYEIKTSRRDFLSDNKYQGYLKYCNTFYFVCPSGIIKKEELQDEIGLLYVSSTGNVLFQKKKAKYRDIEIPQDIFRYILMARVRVHDEIYSRAEKDYNKKYFENWLKEKEINRDFGYHVSKTIKKRIEEEIENVNRKNDYLNDEIKKYIEIQQFLKVNNLRLSEYNLTEKISDKLNEIKTGISKELLNNIDNLLHNLSFIKDKIKEV